MKIIFQFKHSRLRFLLAIVGCLSLTCSYGQTELTDTVAFFGKRPVFPYYYPAQPGMAKDFYSLKKEFTKAITANTTFDGLITIVFMINYEGKTCCYKTQLTDLEYQPLQQTAAVDELRGQVLKAVQMCGPWKPAKDEQNRAINSRKFYSFKFDHGRLIEILPK